MTTRETKLVSISFHLVSSLSHTFSIKLGNCAISARARILQKTTRGERLMARELRQVIERHPLFRVSSQLIERLEQTALFLFFFYSLMSDSHRDRSYRMVPHP